MHPTYPIPNPSLGEAVEFIQGSGPLSVCRNLPLDWLPAREHTASVRGVCGGERSRWALFWGFGNAGRSGAWREVEGEGLACLSVCLDFFPGQCKTPQAALTWPLSLILLWIHASKIRGNAKIQREESSPIPREVPETSQATLFKWPFLCPL